MKSVGEVMAIGRTFEESLQKAIRQIAPNYDGFEAYVAPEDLDHALSVPTDTRLFALAHAMLNKGYDVEKLHDLTKIDRFFLYKLDNIVQIHRQLKELGSLSAVDKELMLLAKQRGFSDKQMANLLGNGVKEVDVRKHRKALGVTPFVKRIDTVAGEYPAHTNYLFTTYNASSHDVEFNEHGTMVLGSGVYRIGEWAARAGLKMMRAAYSHSSSVRTRRLVCRVRLVRRHLRPQGPRDGPQDHHDQLQPRDVSVRRAIVSKRRPI